MNNFHMRDYMTQRISQQEYIQMNGKLHTNYLPFSGYPQRALGTDYNGKPFDLLYEKPKTTCRPFLLDEYGDDYEVGRNIQTINTTNREMKEVSGFSVYPTYIPKDPIKSKGLKVVGSL